MNPSTLQLMMGSAFNAPIEYVGITAPVLGGVGSATVSVPVPAGARAGDLLLLCACQDSATVMTSDAIVGMTEVLDSNNYVVNYMDKWDGVRTNYVVTKSSTGRPIAAMMAFRNARFDLIGSISIAKNLGNTIPAVTPSVGGSAIVLFESVVDSGASRSTADYSQPASYTEVADLNYGFGLAYRLDQPATSTGALSYTGPGATDHRAVAIVLKPG